MNRQKAATYAQVMAIALAASVIYSAPYLRQLFKTSLLEAFSLTEAQLGNLSSTYAVSCLICYVPGGWLADRVEALDDAPEGHGLGLQPRLVRQRDEELLVI